MNITHQNFKDMNTLNQDIEPTYMFEHNSPIRIANIGNALFDKAILFSQSTKTEEEAMNCFTTIYSGYEDVFFFFIPQEQRESSEVLRAINEMIDKFKNGVDPELFGDNDIILAFKEHEKGLIVGLMDSDACWGEELQSLEDLESFDDVEAEYAEDEEEDEEEQDFVEAKPLPPEHQQVLENWLSFENMLCFGNQEEASGVDYFSYFGRSYPAVLEFFKIIGFFDKECHYWTPRSHDN